MNVFGAMMLRKQQIDWISLPDVDYKTETSGEYKMMLGTPPLGIYFMETELTKRQKCDKIDLIEGKPKGGTG